MTDADIACGSDALAVLCLRLRLAPMREIEAQDGAVPYRFSAIRYGGSVESWVKWLSTLTASAPCDIFSDASRSLSDAELVSVMVV